MQNRKLKDDVRTRRRERHKVKNNEFMEYHVVFLFLASCLNSQIFYNFHHTYAEDRGILDICVSAAVADEDDDDDDSVNGAKRREMRMEDDIFILQLFLAR